MNASRLFIRTSLAVLALLLSGFHSPSRHPAPPLKKPPAAELTPPPQPILAPLDLSVPFTAAPAGNDANGLDDDADILNDFNGLFAAKPKKIDGPLQLRGGWIASPEPEVEKRKSVDGASIMINIKE